MVTLSTAFGTTWPSEDSIKEQKVMVDSRSLVNYFVDVEADRADLPNARCFPSHLEGGSIFMISPAPSFKSQML